MKFVFLVALSHLRSRRHEAGISVITFVSILGVTVGVTALIMVLAVMEGFELDLRDKILGSNAHLVVISYNGNFEKGEEVLQKVSETPGVSAAAPFVYFEMMIRSKSKSSGVVFKGIDPLSTGAVTDVASNIIKGPAGNVETMEDKRKVLANLHKPERALFQSEDDTAEYPGILIGDELAKQLWVGVGDRVHIINPVGSGVGLMGMPTPEVKSFRVAGIFYSGMYEYDTKWTYVSIEDAQSFLKMASCVSKGGISSFEKEAGDSAEAKCSAVRYDKKGCQNLPKDCTWEASLSGIEAKVDEIDDAGVAASLVEKQLGYPYIVRHWKELNQNLFSALHLEKIVMGLILSLIVMVASLNIVGTLILVVLTRGREISILRAMGSSSRQICAIFMLEGLIIGLVGTVIGTILGLAGCYGLDQYRFPLDTDVYYLDTLPVVVEPQTVVFVSLSAVLISFIATIYPAVVAAKMDPVEGLRYE